MTESNESNSKVDAENTCSRCMQMKRVFAVSRLSISSCCFGGYLHSKHLINQKK